MPPRKETITRTALTTATATTSMNDAAIRALIARGVADALVEQEIQRNTTSMVMEAKVLEVELVLMCERMFPKESDEVEKYVGGLFDMIQGNVMSARPKTMQEAIELANDLMDQKNVAQTYAGGTGERKEYAGTLPLCNKYKFHHNGPCTARHYKSDCLKLENQNHGNQAKGTEARGMVYALGAGETNQDLDDMEDDINA
nr:hypothetical protein [Tanacetum cinerariifolium]